VSVYSIKDLETLSGIKAHTIRMWEKRYGLLEPNRTDTNIRLYGDNELKHLLNVSLLLGMGYKISKISAMSRKIIAEEIQSNFEKKQPIENLAVENKVNSLIVSMIDLDEYKFNQIYSRSIEKRGLEDTFIQVIYPFLARVGILWGINEVNPAEEHFISNLIRQKLITSTDALPLPKADNPSFMLFLPENELHELGLLLSNYIIRKAGLPTFYLGQNVPLPDALTIAERIKPNYIVLFFVTALSRDEIPEYLESIQMNFKNTQIMVSGASYLFEQIVLPNNTQYLTHLADLKRVIESF
jgi:DNA-binding transcriptional MerR regulator